MSEQQQPSLRPDDEHARADWHTSDVNVPLVVTIGVVSLILLVVIGLGTVAWYRYERQQEQWEKVMEAPPPRELRTLNLEAEARIRGIDAAMTVVAERYRDATPEQRGALREAVPVDEAAEAQDADAPAEALEQASEDPPEDAEANDANNGA